MLWPRSVPLSKACGNKYNQDTSKELLCPRSPITRAARPAISRRPAHVRHHLPVMVPSTLPTPSATHPRQVPPPRANASVLATPRRLLRPSRPGRHNLHVHRRLGLPDLHRVQPSDAQGRDRGVGQRGRGCFLHASDSICYGAAHEVRRRPV